jgi:membrane-associated phospholipid phosphatase
VSNIEDVAVQPLSRSSFSGRREVALGLGVYALALLVRAAVVTPPGRVRAKRNARRILSLERRLGLDVEPEVQRLLLPRTRLLAVLNVAYVVVNIVLTVGWLLRLFGRRDRAFHRFRAAAVLSLAGAQTAFLLFPTAPPRSLGHLVDTIREVSGVDLDSGLVARLYNPLAAMPSIHLAFAVVTSAAIVETTGSAPAKALAVVYPPVVAVTVVATANHFVLDVVAGAALGAGALRVAARLSPARTARAGAPGRAP